MNDTIKAQYQARFTRVFEYIEQNLDQALPLEKLAEVAHFSKYHFHRQFSALTGVGVYRYVQMLKLKRAGYQLSFRSQLKIVDIALEAGFENAESFSRAFSKIFGQSPSAFRKAPNWHNWQEKYHFLQLMEPENMQNLSYTEVKIVDFPTTTVAALEHLGPPQGIMNSVRRFITWRKRNKLGPQVSKTFNIFYHDPNTVAAKDYRMDICASTTKPVDDNPEGVINKTIEGGRCAVLRHTGSDALLHSTVQWLYAAWLAKSGEQLRDFPLFIHRVNLFPDIAENEMISDIYLPIC